jgi:hypothetical protein
MRQYSSCRAHSTLHPMLRRRYKPGASRSPTLSLSRVQVAAELELQGLDCSLLDNAAFVQSAIWELERSVASFVLVSITDVTVDRLAAATGGLRARFSTRFRSAVRAPHPPPYSDAQSLRIVTVGISGGRTLTRVSRRPPISLYMIVARAHMYTYAAKFWDLSIVQGHFLSPRAKP